MIGLRDVVLEFLRRQEEEAGSKAALARACNISRESLSQAMRGRNWPQLEWLDKFCRNTGTAPHRLLMALLAVANSMETQADAGLGAQVLRVDYQRLPGSATGQSFVVPELAEHVKPSAKSKRPRRKSPRG